MKFGMTPAPFQRSKRTTTHIMLELTLALLIVVAVAIGFQFTESSKHGVAAILIILTSVLTTLVLDIIVGLLQKEKNLVKYVIKNYSYVTAIIFALCLPVGTHLYIVAIGALFATLVGKAVFGGFGKNIGNPAIIGRIFVSIAFGSRITGLVKDVAGKITTGATITTDWAGTTKWLSSDLGGMKLWDILLGNYQGALGETFTLLILALGVILVIRKVIDYRQPVFYLGTVLVASLFIALLNGYDVGNYLVLQLGLGGLAFGAIFMLTDPVTTPTSPMGKIISSILGGFLVVLIRVKAGAVEGVMYSILLVNVLTPVIDGFIAGTTTKKLPKQYAVAGGVFVGAILLSVIGCYRPKAPAPTVASVTITEERTEVTQGKSYNFTATVVGENNPAKTVTWEISGNDKSTTTINNDGKLEIAADETIDKEITLKAISTVDTTKFGTKVVTVKEAAAGSITVSSSKQFEYDTGHFTTVNASFTVTIADTKISEFEVSVTPANDDDVYPLPDSFKTKFASATGANAIDGMTLVALEAAINGAAADPTAIGTGATGTIDAYIDLMKELIAEAKQELSNQPKELSGSKPFEYDTGHFTTVNVSFIVSEGIISEFEVSVTPANDDDVYPLPDSFKTKFASATGANAIDGMTLVALEAAINGAAADPTAIGTGATGTIDAYIDLMKELIAEAKGTA